MFMFALTRKFAYRKVYPYNNSQNRCRRTNLRMTCSGSKRVPRKMDWRMALVMISGMLILTVMSMILFVKSVPNCVNKQ